MLGIHPDQEQHQALQKARLRQKAPDFKQKYAKRAGIEGTISQGVRGFDLGVCGVAEQKSGLSYELASQVDWQERKKRRFRSFLLILCFLYIFCLLM